MRITRREHEILMLVSIGLQDNGIAKRLKISSRTVGTHLGKIYVKMGVRNRVSAVIKYREYVSNLARQ